MNNKASITALMSAFGRRFTRKTRNIRFLQITLQKS